MPKILRIINRFNLGGPTYNVALLSKHLGDDFETLLIGGGIGEGEIDSGHIVSELGLRPTIIPEMCRELNLVKDIKAYRKISKIIKEFRPDIVHTHASKSGTLGRLAAYRNKVPVILHTFHGHVFHSYFGSVKTKFFLGIERFLAKRSTKIIAISERQKVELAEIYRIAPKEKIVVIPLGFELEKFQEDVDAKRMSFRKKYLLDDNEIAIGIIGRLVSVKNHELFINAMKFVFDKCDLNIRLFIVGDGDNRAAIERECEKCKLDFVDFRTEKRKAQVTFTSWIKDIQNVYPGLDLVSLSSRNEGTPVSLIEAQASGKPIVCTNVGGIEDVVLPGETALLSESGNPEEFGECILTILQDENLRNGMAEKGWPFVKDKFHYNRLIADVRMLYLNLLTK